MQSWNVLNVTMGKDKSDPDIVKWIVDAISKIKKEKQNPGQEHIIDTVKACHASTSSEVVEEQLVLAVSQGIIEKHLNKGAYTFRIVGKSSPRKQAATEPSNNFENDCLTVRKDTDLTPIVTAAIAALDEKTGSTLKNIERFIVRNYSIECADGIELSTQIRYTTKKAVSRSKLQQEGRYYRLSSENGTASDAEPSSRRSSVTRKQTTATATTTASDAVVKEETVSRCETPEIDGWQYEVTVIDADKAKVCFSTL